MKFSILLLISVIAALALPEEQDKASQFSAFLTKPSDDIDLTAVESILKDSDEINDISDISDISDFVDDNLSPDASDEEIGILEPVDGENIMPGDEVSFGTFLYLNEKACGEGNVSDPVASQELFLFQPLYFENSSFYQNITGLMWISPGPVNISFYADENSTEWYARISGPSEMEENANISVCAGFVLSPPSPNITVELKLAELFIQNTTLFQSSSSFLIVEYI